VAQLAFVDVESTGVDADRHELWEMGLILREDGEDREYAWQVVPGMAAADPAALRIGGYYQRCRVSRSQPGSGWTLHHPGAMSGPDLAAHIAAEVAHLLDGAVLVAANVGFDAAFLDRFLRRHNHAPAWNYHLLEIESYAAGALRMEPPWKLDRFLDAFGIKVAEEDRHTALGDARAARDLYSACLNSDAVAAARGPRD
jgi:hypothetical protein